MGLGFLGPTGVHIPNNVSIGSTVIALLTIVTEWQTDHATLCNSRPHVLDRDAHWRNLANWTIPVRRQCGLFLNTFTTRMCLLQFHLYVCVVIISVYLYTICVLGCIVVGSLAVVVVSIWCGSFTAPWQCVSVEDGCISMNSSTLTTPAEVNVVQLMPLPAHRLLLQLNPEWFTFLVPAYPGCPGKKAVERMYIVGHKKEPTYFCL